MKTLLALILSFFIFSVAHADNIYRFNIFGIGEGYTLEEISEIENLLQALINENHVWVSGLEVLPDDWEPAEEQIEIPDERDI